MDPVPPLSVGDTWDKLETAKLDVQLHLKRRGWSWARGSQNKEQWCLKCIDIECQFRIRLGINRKETKLTKYDPHTCSLLTHQNFSQRTRAKLLAHDQRNRAIIASDERSKAKELQKKRAYFDRPERFLSAGLSGEGAYRPNRPRRYPGVFSEDSCFIVSHG